MSMIGQFVQVTPELLNQVRERPSSVIQLFENDQPALPIAVNTAAGQQLQSRMPQMLAATLGRMDPALQEAVTQRLGVTVESLRAGGGGEQIMNWMANRRRDRTSIQGKGTGLSIEKAWHGVHYLLSGDVEPRTAILSQAILGGAEIGEDLGYGPARYFTLDRVVEIADELSRKELPGEMSARFDPERMSQLGIYPQGWKSSDVAWLLEEFRRVRDFYADAKARHYAVLACLA
jgi:hypothetical protein